jgi:von Willebrand factor type A domain
MSGGKWLKILCILTLIPMGWRPAAVVAQPSSCITEQEPNNDPAGANKLTDVETCVQGSIGNSDQDLFVWTLSEADAKDRWSFSMTGIQGQEDIVKIVTLDYAADGTTVEKVNEVATFTSPGFNEPATAEDVILPPGTYDIGVSASGAGDYTFTIARGHPFPKNRDKEPNDDADTARPLKGAFEISGNLKDSEDWYAWTISDADAKHDWTLSLSGLATYPPALAITDQSGNEVLSNTTAGALGRLVLVDVGLDAGTYLVKVGYSQQNPSPYVLSAVAGEPRRPNIEEEPDEDIAKAGRFDPTKPFRGRLTAGQTIDYLIFTVDDALSNKLFDLKLFWKNKGTQRSLCLVDRETQQDLVCQSGDQGVALTNLRLPPGDVYIRIQGDPAPNDPYILRLDATSAFDPTFETEPNDSIAAASALDPSQVMRGRFGTNDMDFFKFTITGEPQLWEVDLKGEAISDLSLYDAAQDGLQDARAGADGDQTIATLWDLFLVPGEHWLRVAGAHGDYTLTMTPLGPPDPNGEREPNGDVSRAELLRIGATRTGRLPSTGDLDTYRFSLAAPEHVRLNIKSPADGGESIRLDWSPATTITQLQSAAPGAPVIYDAFLQPGDYAVTMAATQPSKSPYEITLEREDPFVFPVDREPNDQPWEAAPLPKDLSATGNLEDYGQGDWYAIPAQAQGGTIAIAVATTEQGDIQPRLVDDTQTDLGLVSDATQTIYTATVPSGKPLFLLVSGRGNYAFTVSFNGQPQAPAVPSPETSPEASPEASPVASTGPVQLTLTPKEKAVAAYWTEGQKVDAVLTITNSGASAANLALDAVTSDLTWSVALGQTSVSVGAGQSMTMPLAIKALPDTHAGQSVRVTVRATSDDGNFTTGFADIDVDRDAPPANPEQSWSVPDALLGGLNVAQTALGAVPISSTDGQAPDQLATLFDDMALPDNGFRGDASGLPVTVTVQLAGNKAMPIAGVALFPQPIGVSSSYSGSDETREFEILLSTDGSTFASVYSGVLSPLPYLQYFVFDKPVDATFAQIVFKNNYNGNQGNILLGEWQVIAKPGVMPGGIDRINIANPGLGGHYVRATPNLGDLTVGTAMLDENLARVSEYAQEGQVPSFTIGFDHDRAAQINRFEWVDSTESTPDTSFQTVEISVSVDSPNGPWTTVGSWKLNRAKATADKPMSFKLKEPVWARFVRFTGTKPAPGGGLLWDFPGVIRAFEVTNTDDYQSVVGAWGWNTPVGIYEKLEPPQVQSVGVESTPNDTPDQAQVLSLGETARDTVQIGKDVDWYQVQVPEGMNQLEFTVTGTPAVDVDVSVIDDQGNDVPAEAQSTAADVTVFKAQVEPGKTYKVKVEQPQHSIVLSFDTSASIGNFTTEVYSSLTTFASEVVPGQENVNFLPFGEDMLLDDWVDQPYLLESAINNYPRTAQDSNSPLAVSKSTAALAGQPGAKAILLITDADTDLLKQGEAWDALDTTRPRIFSVQIAALDARNPQERGMMEDWAMVNKGFFVYASTQSDIDVSFDRTATWLRRPAAYTLTAKAIEAPTPTPAPTDTPVPTATPMPTATPTAPGRIQVLAPKPQAGQPAKPLVAANTAVEIVFDTSGSMLSPLEGSTRADIAKSTLIDLVTNTIPAGTLVALRTFGNTPNSCDTSLAAPLQPLDPQTMANTINNVPIVNLVKTPIGDSLRQVANDLKDVNGPKIIVLVTDGEETCGGDAEAAIRELVGQGIDVHVNIVGFALDDQALKDQFNSWARIGHGTYIDAGSAEELTTAVQTAVQAPFRVLDANGKVVATGVVGGGSVSVPPGTYTVEVLSDPERTVEGVEVDSGKRTKVQLE